MTSRPRLGGVNPGRPRAVVRRVFEEFKPMSEWKQKEESDLLLVYLPGFPKENIRVTAEIRNIVRVTGERVVAGNKWSRFQEDFPIPGNCIIRGIRAKFDGGILTVTMPRESAITQVGTKDEAKTTKLSPSPLEPTTMPTSQTSQEGIASHAASNSGVKTPESNTPSSQTSQEDKIVQAAATNGVKKPQSTLTSSRISQGGNTSQAASISGVKKGESTNLQSPNTPESMTQKNYTSIVGSNQPTINSKSLEDKIPQNVVEDLISRNGEVETPVRAITGTSKATLPDGTSNSSSGNVVHEQTVERNETKQSSDGKESHRSVVENGEEKIRKGFEKDSETPQDDIVNNRIVEKISKKKHEQTGAPTASESYNLENYKQFMNDLSRGLNEQRQLLVNMGVAVLVIVALGAYVSYSFGCSGKAKQ